MLRKSVFYKLSFSLTYRHRDRGWLIEGQRQPKDFTSWVVDCPPSHVRIDSWCFNFQDSLIDEERGILECFDRRAESE